MPAFIAHYLRIEWLDQGAARQIEISADPIEIEETEDGVCQAETQVFKDFYPWVGLHFTDPASEVPPHLVGPDGRILQWLRITDAEGRGWWVQNNGWDSEKHAHLSEMHRSFGRFDLRVGAKRLLLSNVAIDLNRAEAEDYLADFRDELISLALSLNVSASGEVVRSDSRDLVDALSEFSQASRRVLDNPARELAEIEQIQTMPRLRPNARTFREVLRHPGRRAYPGRGARDDANIPDNRYVRSMVQYCKNISSRIGHAADSQAQRLSERMERERAYGNDLAQADSEKVDSVVFENQLAEMRDSIAAINDWRSCESVSEGSVRDFCIKLESAYDYLPRTLFYKRPGATREDDKKLGITSSIVQIPEEPHQLVTRVSKSLGNYARIFTFTGTAEIRRHGNKQNLRLLQLSNVDRMNVKSPGLDEKAKLGKRYSENGWVRKLSLTEREERQLEARSIERRADKMARQAEASGAAGQTLLMTSDNLKAQDLEWSALGVDVSADFPLGMRFIQSPAYTSVLAAFNRVRDIAGAAGIGGAEFEQIERISILHASTIYERWCLIKLISVLSDTYSFTPDPDWLDSVIKGVAGPVTPFKLTFNRSDIGMTALLEVQPVLENGKRPDFCLTFFHKDNNGDHAAENGDFARHGEKSSRGLILDAKFRTRWRPEEPDRVLRDIVDDRGYGRAARRVFILQPAAGAVKRATSPLAWGHDCDFGQNNPNNHQEGIVRLSPDPGVWHNLHRLVAMELQSSFSAPAYVDDERWVSASFCIGCGCRHDTPSIRHRLTKKKLDFWILTCSECNLVTTRTHCFSGCGTTLFKNGLVMTYHLSLADQPTNIKCPACGEFFDRENQETPSYRDD